MKPKSKVQRVVLGVGAAWYHMGDKQGIELHKSTRCPEVCRNSTVTFTLGPIHGQRVRLVAEILTPRKRSK